jgi:hypothetical protein
MSGPASRAFSSPSVSPPTARRTTAAITRSIAVESENGRKLLTYSPITHIVIPDTQAKPGVPDAHLRWVGQYIVDHFAGKPHVKVIHLGDHWDMPSLSSYDRGKRQMEGRRVQEDIDAGNAAFARLNSALTAYNSHRETDDQWWPERHFLLGNHEDRITRAIEDDAQLEGLLTLDSLNATELGWAVHDYLDPVFIDGIGYSHYWANPLTGRPYTGMAITRLKTIGHSFTMGHQQTLDYAVRFVRDDKGEVRSQHGLVAGACYLHDEEYKGYQGNAHWRGIVVCHAVHNGSYNAMFVDLEYLCQRYEGMSVNRYLKKIRYRPWWKA